MCEDQPVWEVLSDAKAEMAVVIHASNSDPAIAQAALRCLIALARYVPLPESIAYVGMYACSGDYGKVVGEQ